VVLSPSEKPKEKQAHRSERLLFVVYQTAPVSLDRGEFSAALLEQPDVSGNVIE